MARVRDGGGSPVGPPCQAELTCDMPLLGTISDALETDTYCFCVTDLETVRISVVEEPPLSTFVPSWRLLDSAGNPATSCGVFATTVATNCALLPAAGSPYRIEIEDQGRNDVGSYRVYFQRLTAGRGCEDTPVDCDVPVSLTLNSAMDEDLASFAVSDGEVVRVTVAEGAGAPANFNPNWRLIDRVGTGARGCDTFVTTIGRDCGPLTAGGNPYRIEVEDGGRNDFGLFHLHVQHLNAVRACENEPLPCDTAVNVTLEHPADSDLLSFRVSEAEIVRITVLEPASQPANFNPSWRLIDGSGNAAVFCGAFTTTVSVNCGPLPGSGNPYRLEVEDGARNDTGLCIVNMQRLSSLRGGDQNDLACGVTEIGITDSAIDTDLFRFVTAEGETWRVGVVEQVDPLHANYNPNWRLLDGAGTPMPPIADT